MISDARKNHGMSILHENIAEFLAKIARTGQLENKDKQLASIYASSLDKRSKNPPGHSGTSPRNR